MTKEEIEKLILSYGYRKDDSLPYFKNQGYSIQLIDGFKIYCSYSEKGGSIAIILAKGEKYILIYHNEPDKKINDNSDLKKHLEKGKEIIDALDLSGLYSLLKKQEDFDICLVETKFNYTELKIQFKITADLYNVFIKAHLNYNGYTQPESVKIDWNVSKLTTQDNNSNAFKFVADVIFTANKYDNPYSFGISSKMPFKPNLSSSFKAFISDVKKKMSDFDKKINQMANGFLDCVDKLESSVGKKAELTRIEPIQILAEAIDEKFQYDLYLPCHKLPNGSSPFAFLKCTETDTYIPRCWEYDISKASDVEISINELKKEFEAIENASQSMSKSIDDIVERMNKFPELSTRIEKTNIYNSHVYADFISNVFRIAITIDFNIDNKAIVNKYLHLTPYLSDEANKSIKIPRQYQWKIDKMSNSISRQYDDFSVEQTDGLMQSVKELCRTMEEIIDID